MGKIRDLFVRLGLKSDGLKKGIRNAQQEVQNFGKKLGNMKAGALAVWAAIGAAVTKVGKDFISATNKMNDAWEATMAKMKAEYHAFLAAMSNTNFGIDTSGSGNKVVNAIKNEVQWWKKLFGTVKEAGAAAHEAAQSFDQEFELVRSVNLQRRMIQGELDELEVKMKDMTLSPAARQAAADRYYQLLEPIFTAEAKIYKDMLSAAVKEWSAGMGLDRSEAEILEFFRNVGTQAEAMAAKFPDINDIFQNKKGDKQNDIIFQIYDKFLQAEAAPEAVRKKIGRTTNAIKAEIFRSLEDIAKAVKEYGQEDLNLDLELEIDLSLDEAEIEAGMAAIDQYIQSFADNWRSQCEDIKAQNEMLEQSFISSMSGGLQAVTDMLFGIEGAGPERVLAALLQPFAQTATQLGEMLIAQGIAIEAFKDSLKTLQPGVAIAAGLSLIAVGAAISSGIQALAGGPRGATSASTGASATSAGGVDTYEQEITVHVVGEISGNNIVLAGQKTLNKWSR